MCEMHHTANAKTEQKTEYIYNKQSDKISTTIYVAGKFDGEFDLTV